MIKLLLILLALVGLAFVTNPGAQAHRDKLKAEVAARSQLAGLLHLGDLAAFVSTYHTLGVASYSTVDDKALTYGAFGFVFVPDGAAP